LPIIVMLFGVATLYLPSLGLNFLSFGNSFFPVTSCLVIVIGAAVGLLTIFKRDIAKRGRPGVLTSLACISWSAFSIAILLLMFAPGVYGYDLAILFNAASTISWFGLFGIVFTSVALLR